MLAHKEYLGSISGDGFTEGSDFLPIALSRWAKRNRVSVSSVSVVKKYSC